MCPILVDIFFEFLSNLLSIFELNLNFNIMCVGGMLSAGVSISQRHQIPSELELQWVGNCPM